MNDGLPAKMNKIITLNGLWDFVVDLDPKYHQARNYASPSWDRRHWLKVPVPSVWNKYGERYDIFEGVAWFGREFTLAEMPLNAKCLLRFGGVNYLCEVYVNGALAGAHEGGYTEFTLDVSRLVRTGTNSIVVRVDNRSLNMKLPPVLGYFNYGGIHRDVALEIYPGAYLVDVNVIAEPCAGGGGTLGVFGRVANAEASCVVRLTCEGHAAQANAAADGRFSLALDVPTVQPWSPDKPALYRLAVDLLQNDEVFDGKYVQIGFRLIHTNGTQIELNGQPIDLRGICYLYDSPSYGLTMRSEQYDQDLALLKELHVNAIRSHFSFTEEFLSACDRAGIIVWVEPPVYCIDPQLDSCRTAFSDPVWRALALQMIGEMIGQAKLHPSVCIYGIGNECQLEAPGAMEFFRTLAVRARELDSSRLLSYACLYGLAGDIVDVVDVVGFNEYWGWYDVLFGTGQGPDDAKPVSTAFAEEGTWTQHEAKAEVQPRQANLSKLDKMLSQQATACRKPVLLTEFGADSIPGYRSGARELWSEDYHAHVIEETLAIAERTPIICGTFPFAYSDYRDPSKEVNGYWDELNYKGVVTYERRKKLPFFTLQAAYAKRYTS